MPESSNPSSHEIVVGIDGSEASKKALTWAAEQAKRTGAPLEAVITWQFPTSFGWAPAWPEEVDFAGDARKMLDETIAEVLGSSPDLSVRTTVVEGHPAPVLFERSKTTSLIVIGSRGHGAFAGMVLGSVSEFLAAHAHCPVVIVHAHHEETS